MATTMEELEKRVAALEREVSSLRQELGIRTAAEKSAESERIKTIWARTLEQLGIHREPIGAEKLQAMMLAEGIKPEENLLSRGIRLYRE
jgi:hypothetical protein